MKVLVSVASKHGATRAIAGAIADQVRTTHVSVDVVAAADKVNLDQYDAFVLGSAIYIGRWMSEARELIEANAALLRERPVWLFSSGPIGDRRDPADSAEGERLLAEIGGREHRLFAGSVSNEGLAWMERLAIRMVKAPCGDYREWSEIRSWGDSIAKELTAVPV